MNDWMAACWKVSWNVDPLALRVPLRLLDVDPLPDVDEEDALPPEELQAAAKVAKAATSPRADARCMRRRCISDTPFSGIP